MNKKHKDTKFSIVWTMCTKTIFALDPGGLFAAHGVVCNEQNFLEGEFTLLELRPYLHRRRLIAYDPSNPLLTPPTKPSDWEESADHVVSRPQVLHCILLRSSPMFFRYWIAMDSSQKRYIRKKSVRRTVIPQHPTSEWQPKYVLAHPQSLFVFRYDVHHLLHHYFRGIKNTRKTAL